MLVVLRIPTRMTIATSLAITFISSIGSTFGKIVTDQILYGPAAIMVVASIIAAPFWSQAWPEDEHKITPVNLALQILGTAIKIWMEIL